MQLYSIYADRVFVFAKAWLVVAFDNKTESDISKLSKIWIILKYYEPVLLPNTALRSCYYLLIIEAETFSVTHKRPLFRFGKKKKTNKQTQASAFVTISLCH